MELTDEIKPIYLGYEVDHKKYYFYFIKEGVPRFLVYVTYFYWDRGPQTVLSLVPVPEAVEEELGQFLSGSLNYEFVKVRKNSKQASVKKLYRLPQQVTRHEPDKVRGTGGRPAEQRDTGLPIPSISTAAQGTSGGDNKVAKRKPKPKVEAPIIKPKRHRRTKLEMSQARASLEAQFEAQRKKLKKPPVVTVADVPAAKKAAASSEVTHAKRKKKLAP